MTLERDDHAAFVAWLRDVAPLRWQSDCIPGVGFPFIVSHSAGKRGGRGIGWAKQQGLQRGIPDFHVPIPRGAFHGLWIELKRGEGKTVESEAQRAWVGWLNLHGFYARFCYGCPEAVETTTRYMEVRAI